VRWARAMPSPASRMGRGLTAVAFPSHLPVGDRRAVRRLFLNVGPVVEIPESKFDAFTVTYSASHGYYQLKTLAQAAVKLGLEPPIALTAAAHALADGVSCWRETGTSVPRLMREAATPGGVAASVLSTMEKGQYGRLLEKALERGLKRARAYQTEW
jgi:pyrroline-5-carboxylate reductase